MTAEPPEGFMPACEVRNRQLLHPGAAADAAPPAAARLARAIGQGVAGRPGEEHTIGLPPMPIRAPGRACRASMTMSKLLGCGGRKIVSATGSASRYGLGRDTRSGGRSACGRHFPQLHDSVDLAGLAVRIIQCTMPMAEFTMCTLVHLSPGAVKGASAKRSRRGASAPRIGPGCGPPPLCLRDVDALERL